MTGLPQTPARDDSVHRQLAELDAIYHSAFIALCVFDPQGRFVRVNQRMAETNGLTINQHIGRTVREVVPDLADVAERLVEQIVRTGQGVRDVELSGTTPAKPGVTRHWIEHWQPLKDGEGRVFGINVVAHEVTEQRQAQDALLRLTQVLEQRVGERTAQLARANDDLQQRTRQLQLLAQQLAVVEQQERRRLASLLHDDLQQVLVGAKLHLQVAAGHCRAHGPLPDALNMVWRLLDEAILKSRSLSHELSNPLLHQQGLISALQWLARHMHGQHGLEVTLELPPDAEPTCEEHKALLYAAVRELLFNVVKHSGVYRATIQGLRQSDALCYTVADGGKGFDPVALDTTAGTGLLNLRERLQALGGRFEIQSSPGEGCRLTLAVPLAIAPSEVAGPAEATPAAAQLPFSRQPLRVLLVDDHAETRQGVADLLASEPDIQVVAQAQDGRQALQLVAQHNPDVVVLDVAMPVMDGVQATRIIRQRWPLTRVVALSVHESDDFPQKLQEAGADVYVSKANLSKFLLDAIRAVRRP